MELVLLPPEATAEHPEMLDGYQTRGGYAAWRLALGDRDPGRVMDEVARSGLRGRGGAGFPTARKWSFMPRDGRAAVLCCNADESEPGTFKDRHLLERTPHQVLEGLMLGCYALGARRGYVFIRCEYVRAAGAMQEAIEQAHQIGLLGENILGSGCSLKVLIRKGAGAYISGEETALLESTEGKRGWPRQKPPFPAGGGLFGLPTTVNNVETLACLPMIVSEGGQTFAAVGTPNNTGPKLYCLSGHVNRPGVYESPMTVTLRELIFDDCFGGGIPGGRLLKAVVPGGSSAPVLRADEIDLAADFDHLQEAGSMLGSAGLIVMDERTCMVRAAANTSRFFDRESCGQCTPCREGSHWVRQVLERIEAGRGCDRDVDLVIDRLEAIEGQTICEFGEAVSWGVGSMIEKFRDEFLEHNRLGRCPVPAWDLGGVAR
ncbi:MAG: NADH-quinone oxidoreductase subunit NuoF [Anaerolineaceae bacterium]|nr:NADH-quinone oxidoreductase subunit NuoF [Anaerolineaceae bacterium]